MTARINKIRFYCGAASNSEATNCEPYLWHFTQSLLGIFLATGQRRLLARQHCLELVAAHYRNPHQRGLIRADPSQISL